MLVNMPYMEHMGIVTGKVSIFLIVTGSIESRWNSKGRIASRNNSQFDPGRKRGWKMSETTKKIGLFSGSNCSFTREQWNHG